MRRAYIPGICNIGPHNRMGRLAFGLFFFTVGVWGWAFFSVNDFPFIARFTLFLPFYFGFLGIYEALFGFCVLLARAQRYDMR